MTRLRAQQHETDSGMSLVELIVAMGVSALLLGLIASIFGQGLLAQQQQTARDSATGQLNLASSFLNESLRNGVAARVDPSDPTRIDVKVRASRFDASGNETVSYECRAWVIAEAQIWYSHGVAPRGAWSTGSDWVPLVKNVMNPTRGSETVGFAASGAGQSFTYFFNVREGDVEVAVRDGGYLGVIEPAGDPLTCW